ncbi:MAG: sulfite exporter TauE/SafE family protein, partial [Candidatus Methanomethylophilaceae archaeon]|nr:sulfite exporter TauE/SafE family protein [Candidatus Methanomethylophilaceae archaeon]
MCIFSVIVFYSALRMILNPEKVIPPSEDDDSRFSFEYNDEANGEHVRYKVENVKGGMALCTVAGMISSMTGVGGGAVKVPLMNIYMHVPIKAASPTSSYMIGITAFSGAITYFISGQVLLEYAAAIAIGAFAGSIVGTSLARKLHTKHLRKYFSILLIVVAALVLLQAGGIL